MKLIRTGRSGAPTSKKPWLWLLAAVIVVFLGVPSALFVTKWAFLIAGDWHSYRWNQKLTVTVDTPDGERSGSSVVHVRVAFQIPCHYIGGSSLTCVSTSFKGAATVVPLPNGKHLFFLLADSPGGMAQAAFRDAIAENVEEKRPATAASFYEFIQDYVGHEEPVPNNRRPDFVTFDDLADPMSVKQVDPTNLAASFGPGYALKSVTLEVTREKPSFDEIEALLPWLDEYGEHHFRLNGKRCIACPVSSDWIADMIGPSDFLWRN